MTHDYASLVAILIFAATYVVIALGKAPGLRLDRAGAALFGASLMVACGVLTLEEAYRSVDLDTIALLLGMMIVVANLRLSGVFRLATAWIVARAHHPLVLLVAIAIITGVLSAFLVNDTICLVMTPIVIAGTRALDRKPLPYLLAVAMASNIGSVATITGNPQNMLIGGISRVPYTTFTAALSPIAAIGLILTIAFVALLHPREFFTRKRFAVTVTVPPARVHRHLAVKSVLVTLAMVAFFFAGQAVAKVALIAGGFLLLTRIVNPLKVYREIDGPLLLMFAGLFVIVAGLEKAVLTPDVLTEGGRLQLGSSWVLTLVTAGLSNLVSNVPAVLVLKPFVAQLGYPQRAWLVVAMASTLAGNLTLIGSVANLIVAERARREGVIIGFWDYAKVGAPLTVLTLVIGVLWLQHAR